MSDIEWRMVQDKAAQSGQTPSEWIRDSLMIRVGKNPDVRPDFPHNEAELHQFALTLYTVLFLERLAGKIGLEGQLPEIMGVVNDVLADYELPAFFEIS